VEFLGAQGIPKNFRVNNVDVWVLCLLIDRIGVVKKHSSREGGTRESFDDTGSGGGEQFLLVDCRAKKRGTIVSSREPVN